jgi:uncharacterized protein YabN with tetrapyrrole methylase and pyrophosphatase domain
MSQRGSVTIVGTGIHLNHLTIETIDAIQEAQKVFYVVMDPITATWILRQSPGAESLLTCYAEGKSRSLTYKEMVEKIMSAVRSDLRVCAVYYGHPGVLVNSAQKVMNLCREEGYKARMLPAVSSEDCLFADLGVDPFLGCHTFEATDFLLRERRFDPCCSLILYQVGIIAELTHNPSKSEHPGLKVLIDRLLLDYPADHPVILYEASESPFGKPWIHRTKLTEIDPSHLKIITTMYVFPREERAISKEVASRMGLII